MSNLGADSALVMSTRVLFCCSGQVLKIVQFISLKWTITVDNSVGVAWHKNLFLEGEEGGGKLRFQDPAAPANLTGEHQDNQAFYLEKWCCRLEFWIFRGKTEVSRSWYKTHGLKSPWEQIWMVPYLLPLPTWLWSWPARGQQVCKTSWFDSNTTGNVIFTLPTSCDTQLASIKR